MSAPCGVRITTHVIVQYADDESEPSSTIYVGNLSYDTTKETLMDEFPGCVSVNIPTDRDSGRPRGYAPGQCCHVSINQWCFVGLPFWNTRMSQLHKKLCRMIRWSWMDGRCLSTLPNHEVVVVVAAVVAEADEVRMGINWMNYV